MVCRCAAVMLQIALPTSLDMYMNHIKQYALRYTHSCWPLIYQADTRARRELTVRMARRFIQERNSLGERANTHPYKPEMPWDYVFLQAPNEFKFWKREVEDPAMLIITKSVTGTPHASGEALVARRPEEHIFEEEPVLWRSQPQPANLSLQRSRRRPK